MIIRVIKELMIEVLTFLKKKQEKWNDKNGFLPKKASQCIKSKS